MLPFEKEAIEACKVPIIDMQAEASVQVSDKYPNDQLKTVIL